MDHVYMNKVIQIKLLDITEAETEAIVNAANTHLWMGAGVAGAIKRKGGIEIEQEAIKKGPIKIGQVVTTTAGKLPIQYVIHAPAMEPGMPSSKENIAKATRAVMEECERLGIKSVALPALGAGIGGVPVNQCAEAMLSQALKYIKEGHKYPERIVFVAISKNVYDAFEEAYQKLQK